MKKLKNINPITKILLVGLAMSLYCSFILGNIILGVLCFIGVLIYLFNTRRGLFIGSKANAAYAKNQIEQSFELYEKAMTQKGCSTMIKIVYAYRLVHAGQCEKSAKILSNLDPMKMDDSEKLNYNATQALVLWKQGNVNRSIEIYEALLNDKQSLLIYETLGYLYICAKQYEKALAFNLKAYEFSDTSEMIKDNLACSYYYLGYHKKAAKLYKGLIEEHVSFPDPYYYYALILNEREKYKSALKYLNLALEKKESNLSQLTHSNIKYMITQIEEYLKSLDEEEKYSAEEVVETELVIDKLTAQEVAIADTDFIETVQE